MEVELIFVFVGIGVVGVGVTGNIPATPILQANQLSFLSIAIEVIHFPLELPFLILEVLPIPLVFPAFILL